MQTEETFIRVLIADDHAVVREGIRHVLGTDHGFLVVGEAARGDEVMAMVRALAPDVVVIDISMPGMTGIEATEEICATWPDARVLVLSIHENEEYVARSVRAGARGYLRKDSSPAELRAAVLALHQGGTCFPTLDTGVLPGVVRADAASGPGSRLASLTAREREVLAEVARGSSNKAVAAVLGISVRTVESHRDSIMRKLDLRGTASLTRFAIDAGLLD